MSGTDIERQIMEKMKPGKSGVLILLMAGLFLSAPAIADKRAWDNDEHHDRYKRAETHDRHDDGRHDQERRGGDFSVSIHFGDRHREVVREYYGHEFSQGRCPPGLRKKHNGCMPPGQAKKWKVGRPLPRDVIFYDLPPRVVIELGAPPPRHRYVRVAGDILLIAIGTGLVIDAIEDIADMH